MRPPAGAPKGRPQRKEPGPFAPEKRTRNYTFNLLSKGNEEMPSPKLLPSDSKVAWGSSLMPLTSNDSEERFCVEGPRVEFGGPLEKPDAEGSARCPLPELARRLKGAIDQAVLILGERVHTLQARQRDAVFSEAQNKELMVLADGINAASYHIEKWAFLLDSAKDARPPFKPPISSDAEYAFASLHNVLPKLMVASSALQKQLMALISRQISPHGPEREADAEQELEKKGLTSELLFSVVAHLEQMVHQANQLSNSLRPARLGGRGGGRGGGYAGAGRGITAPAPRTNAEPMAPFASEEVGAS